MKLENLSNKELAKIADNIEEENKRLANRTAAATAIISVLKKHNLSIGDIAELDFRKRPTKSGRKKAVATKTMAARTKAKPSKKTDKLFQVAYKYKNPKGSEKWSGHGRVPKWVNAILENDKISIAQFKAHKRYKI